MLLYRSMLKQTFIESYWLTCKRHRRFLNFSSRVNSFQTSALNENNKISNIILIPVSMIPCIHHLLFLI